MLGVCGAQAAATAHLQSVSCTRGVAFPWRRRAARAPAAGRRCQVVAAGAGRGGGADDAASSSPPSPPPPPPPATASSTSCNGLSSFTSLWLGAEDFADDVTEVEQNLRQRMAATMEAACAVLQLVEDAAAGEGACGGAGGDEGAAPSPSRRGGSASNSKDAQLAALNNLLKAENNRLRDQALQDATKIKQLQSSLAGVAGVGGWGARGRSWAVGARGRTAAAAPRRV